MREAFHLGLMQNPSGSSEAFFSAESAASVCLIPVYPSNMANPRPLEGQNFSKSKHWNSIRFICVHVPITQKRFICHILVACFFLFTYFFKEINF